MLIGTFTLMGHLTVKGQPSVLSNDSGNPQIEIQLDRIECIPNQNFTGVFRLQLYAGGQEIYDEIIDFSAISRTVTEDIPNARTVTEDIPNARIGNLDVFNAELIMSVEAVGSGVSTSHYIGRLGVEQTIDVTLYLEEGNFMVKGSIRVE